MILEKPCSPYFSVIVHFFSFIFQNLKLLLHFFGHLGNVIIDRLPIFMLHIPFPFFYFEQQEGYTASLPEKPKYNESFHLAT